MFELKFIVHGKTFATRQLHILHLKDTLEERFGNIVDMAPWLADKKATRSVVSVIYRSRKPQVLRKFINTKHEVLSLVNLNTNKRVPITRRGIRAMKKTTS